MITMAFLAGWALRSSILILSGALLLRALRVKDPSIRLAAWTAMLFGCLAIPALTAALPGVPFAIARTAIGPIETPSAHDRTAAATALSRRNDDARDRMGGLGEGKDARDAQPFDWPRAASDIYVAVALALLLRLGLGLVMTRRLLRSSRTTGHTAEGVEIRESGRVTAPVTLGIAHSAIVVPEDWRAWDDAKMAAVLAHELSHIRRRDPAVQLLSAIHRALLWYSPLSWFLHNRIVRAAEEASDDAAVSVTDRALYAEVLLDFIRRGVRGAGAPGVPMARYGRPDQRIHRILDGTELSRGVTRWSAAAILALGSPLAYVVAAAHPQTAAPERTAAAPAGIVPLKPSGRHPDSGSMVAQADGKPIAQAASAVKRDREPHYLKALGSVAAFYTVNVRSRVDGQLASVSFKEGDVVQAGQLLASIDPSEYKLQLAQAQAQLDEDLAQHAGATHGTSKMAGDQDAVHRAEVMQREAKIRSDMLKVEQAALQLKYAQITAPITGVAGLRLVDPGNMVHATDATAIVVITQLEPIAVVFSIPEDNLRQVRSRLKEGAGLPVEAWNRENAVRIATGRLAAVDNQIDAVTGTAKIKAVFDNKDGALFPNQFVNVRLSLDSK